MLKCTKIGLVSIVGLASISLCGCDAKLPFGSTKPNFDTAFTVNAEINCDKLNAKADVTRNGDGDWSFKFTEPQQLAGMTLNITESVCTGTLGNLSFEAEESSEYAMIPEIIADSINSLSKCTNEQIVQNDEIMTYDTDFDGKKVTVTANSKSGALVSLKCPYHKLSVNFSNLKPYKELPTEPTGESTVSENIAE
ncbi:MAG: hypothetical protein HDT42_04860 [Ruminococcaceae bacterium]|nr:hypothetical protein [Oscillospiraceae bacterium]